MIGTAKWWKALLRTIVKPCGFAPIEGDRNPKKYERLLFILQIALSLTLFARGWLTFFWDHYLRGLIWHEEALKPVLEQYFSISWRDFAMSSDSWLTPLIQGIGMWLMIMAGVVLFMGRIRVLRWTLLPVIGFMALDVFARFIEHDGRWGMAMEYALQAMVPLLLFLMLSGSKTRRWLIGLALVATSLCFIGHGCYAMGFYPVPWSYQNMTMRLLGLEGEAVLTFLAVMGYLDFTVVFALFWKRLRKLALCYMIAWGFATAMARVLAHIESSQRWYGLDPWMFETLVRSSHWMIPLALLTLLRKNDNTPLTKVSSSELPVTHINAVH